MALTRRLFVLLGAYEDLTERESAALRRGDIDHAIGLEHRKGRLVEAITTARRNTVLSKADAEIFTRRVRSLEEKEKHNLAFVREQAGQVRSALNTINQAAQRTRQVRRGYVGGGRVANTVSAESVLGRA